jgi:hypothetical protein
LVPIAVCAAAGAQADLPRDKRRAWSRPLIALLFYLQPIVRGWARYRGRLLPAAKTIPAQQSLDSMALRHSGQSLAQADYWSSEPINRFAFIADVLRRLAQSGWPHRADIGWSDYDVEIYDPHWSKLQLTTVIEDIGPGKHVLRCRLKPRWSLRAKVAFFSLCSLELLVLGIVAPHRPWWWLLLQSLALFPWFMHHQARVLQSLTLVFLDETGKDWKLERTHSGTNNSKPDAQPVIPKGESPFTKAVAE